MLYGFGFNGFGQLNTCLTTSTDSHETECADKDTHDESSILKRPPSISSPKEIHLDAIETTQGEQASNISFLDVEVSISWSSIVVIRATRYRCLDHQQKAMSIKYHKIVLGSHQQETNQHLFDFHGNMLSVAANWSDLFALSEDNDCFLITANKNKPPQPIRVENAGNKVQLTSVAAGDSHVLALDGDGRPFTLHKESPGPIFRPLQSPICIKSIDCGHEHVILLSRIGAVFSFGSGSRGQLGHGNVERLLEPKLVAALEGVSITKISAGGWHSLALSDIGDVYAWGWNEKGQIGHRSKGVQCVKRKAPEQSNNADGREGTDEEWVNLQTLPLLIDVEEEGELLSFTDVACGSRHSAAISDAGKLYTWGWNDYGQLGHGDFSSLDRPTLVTLPKKATKVYGGFWNTVVVCC